MPTWKEVSAERYHEMLDILPPALWLDKGFLVGEAWTHRTCTVTGDTRAAYAAFIQYKGKYWESEEPMTGPEFRGFEPSAQDAGKC